MIDLISFIDVSSILADLCCEQKEMIVLYEREEALFAESDSVRIILSESSPSVIGLPLRVESRPFEPPSRSQVQALASQPKQYRPPEQYSWRSYSSKVNYQH